MLLFWGHCNADITILSYYHLALILKEAYGEFKYIKIGTFLTLVLAL